MESSSDVVGTRLLYSCKGDRGLREVGRPTWNKKFGYGDVLTDLLCLVGFLHLSMDVKPDES